MIMMVGGCMGADGMYTRIRVIYMIFTCGTCISVEIRVYAVVQQYIVFMIEFVQYNNIVDNIIYGPRIFITLFSVFLLLSTCNL